MMLPWTLLINKEKGGKLVVYGFHTMLPKQGGRPNWFKLARDWLWTPSFDPLYVL